jgi:hypothetical protein
MVVIVMSLTLLMVVPTSLSMGATPPREDHTASPHTDNAIYNYTTPDSSDITNVAISPNGDWIAAASNTKSLYVFSSSSGSHGAISPAATIPLAGDVGAMALSNSGPGAKSLLVVGVEGTLWVYNASSSVPWWSFTDFTNITTNVTVTVTSVAISADGTAIVAVASVVPTTLSPYYTFVYFKDGNLSNTWKSPAFASPTDVSIDIDGSRAVVGENLNGGGFVELFDPLTAPPTTWSPASTVGPTYGLVDAQISGDGASMYEISTYGFSATTVAHPDETTAEVSLSGASLLSVSYTGCEILIGMGSSANFYDVTGQNVSNCAMADFATPLWSAAYPSSIYSLSLASNRSRYFVVGWGNELEWYYEYAGMPMCSEVAYRTATTNGGIESVALSSNGGTVAVGSAFIVGGGNEFILATDTGVPPLTAISIRPSSYTLSTGATANFTAIPVITGGTCPTGISYSWTLTNSLGKLNSSTGNPVQFTAGSVVGNVTLNLNATQNGVTEHSSGVPITIIPVLSSVSVSPTAAEIATGGSQPFTATPACIGGPCPSGIIYLWTLSNDLAQLENTSRPSVIDVVATAPSGSDTLFVSATLNGVTKQGGPVPITITPNLSISKFTAYPATVAVGSWTNFTVIANGGIGTLTYTYAGLPAGCMSANQSVLACRPTSVSIYDVTVTVTDQVNHSVSLSTTLTVTSVKPIGYSVTFTETGLAAGTNWSVAISGAQHYSTGSSIVFTEPNGTYSYTVVALSGYTTSQSSGNVIVSGNAVLVTVAFRQSSTSQSGVLGMSGDTGYIVIGVIVAAVVVVCAILLLTRGKKKSDKPVKTEEKKPEPAKETETTLNDGPPKPTGEEVKGIDELKPET